MKRDIESEYLSSVAKRTRASTERFLVLKAYGESGVRKRKRKRNSDFEVTSEVERDGDRDRKFRGKGKGKEESGVKVDRGRGQGEEDGFGALRGEAWFDDIPDVTFVDSQGSVGGDDDDVQQVMSLGERKEEKLDRIRKAKEKMAAEDKDDVDRNVRDFVERAGCGVGSEEKYESVQDNDESDGGCKCRKDVGDDSIGSRTELGSTSKAVVDVDMDETVSVHFSGISVENENGKECSGNEVVVSDSENPIVSSTDSEDDASDEDYKEPMTDVSCSSESVTESDADFVEEFAAPRDRRREESYWVECNYKASPCCSDDVIILDDDFAVNENGNYAKAVAEEIPVGGTKENENVVVYSSNNEDKLQEKNLFPGTECSSKPAPKANGIKAKRTKVDDFEWIAYEENANHLENKFSKSTKHAQGFAKNWPEVEVTSAWDYGTVRDSKINNSHGFHGGIEDNNEKQQQGVYQGKCRKETSKTKTRTWEKINLFDILFNTLTVNSGAVQEDLVNFSDAFQQEEHAELAALKSYPMLKFTFGVKTPAQEEKTESEQELDKLWDEFQFELRTSEIGFHAHAPLKTDKDTPSKNVKINPTLCNRGEHKFTLDDEVGIKCQICSFVQLEMKYVMPDWAKFSSRRFNKRSSSDDEDLEMFDGMQFQYSEVGESRSCPGGTVWDLIPEVRAKLYPHQQEGFEFIWQNLMGTINLDELRSSTNHGMGGCIISHAPGTGKTRLTLEFLHSYLKLIPDSCPLIIAPAGMLLTWEAEFKKWNVGIPFHNLNSTVLSGKEDRPTLNIFYASKQSSNTNLMRLVKLLSWKKEKSILGLSYSLFEKLAGQRFAVRKESQSSNKSMMDEQAKEFGKIILESAGLLVLDEGHTPRNPRSRIYKALTNIQTKKRIILSGTPFQNNLAELFTILSFVRPDFERTISPELRKFCQRKVRMVYGSSGRSGAEPDVDRGDRQAISELKTKIDPFVHVHKGSVLQESLPGLKDCVMVLNPPQYQKQLVEMIESNSYTNFEFEHKLSLATIHPSLLQNEKDESFIDKRELESRRLDPTEGVKTKFLFEMIRLSEANNEKVLVFSQYLDPLGLIKDQICSLMHWREGEEVLQLVGAIESEQRQTIINMFNNPRSRAKVLLASTKACSEGINLVGASRVVLLDVVWNPSVERQAISRAFRLGQKKVVYSYNLIVGRMEWEKYRAQANKEHVSNLVFSSSDEPEKRSRVLSEDKILDELLNHGSMEGMFDQIVYHPKDKLFS